MAKCQFATRGPSFLLELHCYLAVSRIKAQKMIRYEILQGPLSIRCHELGAGFVAVGDALHIVSNLVISGIVGTSVVARFPG